MASPPMRSHLIVIRTEYQDSHRHRDGNGSSVIYASRLMIYSGIHFIGDSLSFSSHAAYSQLSIVIYCEGVRKWVNTRGVNVSLYPLALDVVSRITSLPLWKCSYFSRLVRYEPRYHIIALPAGNIAIRLIMSPPQASAPHLTFRFALVGTSAIPSYDSHMHANHYHWISRHNIADSECAWLHTTRYGSRTDW